MFTDDTIAAISTPLGQGGIGIVRLSGRDSIKIADSIFRSPKKKKISNSPSHRIIYGHIVNPQTSETIDEVLVSVMKSPNTYTREDIIEINCHGGALPLRMVLELLLQAGARLAEPGEFTKRAFLNGRIDLAQAEAVLDVINALTAQSHKTALVQLRGRLSRKIEAIRDKLIELTAFVEAHIDFPEEDIAPLSLKEMRKMAVGIQQPLRSLIDSSVYGRVLREGVKTAIIGRPNVGKSSLLNALLEHDRAIVTEAPGTTRDVIEEYLNIQGLPVRIMDTAGIRSVRNIAEKEGVRRSLETMEDADLVLLVLDGGRALNAADRELIKKSDPHKTVLIVNKIDLPQKIRLPLRPPSKGGIKKEGNSTTPTIRVSAKEGTGLDRLKRKIVDTALHGQRQHGADIVTNVRHVHALERALKSIESFIKGADEKTSPEFLSVDLREALDALGEIMGITTPDDILNRIFENFCIGK